MLIPVDGYLWYVGGNALAVLAAAIEYPRV